MSTELFRKEALAKYVQVDAPGAIITIAPPRTIAIFATMTLLFIALLLATTSGTAQMTAEGRGVVRPNEPPVVLQAPFAGTVLAIAREVHGDGRAGDLLVTMDARTEEAAREQCSRDVAAERKELGALEKRLAEWNDVADRGREASMALVLLSQIRTQREKTQSMANGCDALGKVTARSRVTFPVDARVADLAVAVGTHVHEGDVLATLIPTRARLVGYVALGEQHRSELAVGQAVRVKFDALPYSEVGVGHARVARILDALPSTVKIDAAPTAGVFAEISIDDMPAGSGPPRTGMTFTADVLTRRRSVLSLLFGGPSHDP